jgi:hypothetical protein
MLENLNSPFLIIFIIHFLIYISIKNKIDNIRAISNFFFELYIFLLLL